ncbi:MAG: M20 family metallo-hydrolase [Dongiaceae bacterium]
MNAQQRIAKLCGFVDEDRLWRRHMELAQIGALASGGVNRQALSAEDIDARHLLIGWARKRGYRVETDAIANLYIRRAGRYDDRPTVATGSHIDTQPLGGRFDGAYGVLAGIEVLESLDDAGIETDHPITVVAWTNEEGSRFAPGAMGSLIFSGLRRVDEFSANADAEGTTLSTALKSTLAAMDTDRQLDARPAFKAYIEAHIEQGPVLEARNIEIGAVTGIQGTRWFEVEVNGRSAHAGTTPMSKRADAITAAIDIMIDLRKIAEDPEDRLRFTMGRVDVVPNSPNTIPEQVRFTIDMRHPEQQVLEDRTRDIVARCTGTSAGCRVAIREVLTQPPCNFPEAIVARVENAANALPASCMRLPSGAFHDALFVARICPTGMIFVPCRDGISHNPTEYAEPAHLAAGARVLAATLVGLAEKDA